MYLRVFERKFQNWYGKEPSLATLLGHFRVTAKETDFSASVYAADNEAESLQSAAALYQTFRRRSVGDLFAVCVTQDDCSRASIGIEADAHGKTGVKDVDQRHANLTGSQEQFSELIAQILARFWEGENRLRVFPAWQILGELAVLARLLTDQIAEGARENCQRVLENHADMLNYLDDGSSVEVTKDLRWNHLESRVVAVRSF